MSIVEKVYLHCRLVFLVAAFSGMSFTGLLAESSSVKVEKGSSPQASTEANQASVDNMPLDPQLTIDVGAQKVVFKRSELLSRSDLRTLKIAHDPSFPGRTMTYKAVPVVELFEGLKVADDAVIQFRCTDGFAAPISKDRLLNIHPSKSHAYVAVEDPREPWPSVKPGGPVAGPFYLVWPDADLSQIMQEEWPFQLTAFEVKGTLASLYPKIFPDKLLPQTHQVRHGMDVFVKNCFPCHTLNQSGASQVGPDLNVPHSPTEYLAGSFLRQLIRDNQSVRYFPDGKMSPFPPEILSDKDLDALLAYLKHMAKHKWSNNSKTQFTK